MWQEGGLRQSISAASWLDPPTGPSTPLPSSPVIVLQHHGAWGLLGAVIEAGPKVVACLGGVNLIHQLVEHITHVDTLQEGGGRRA